MNEKTKRILIRQSDAREKLNALNAVAEPTEAQERERSQLTESMAGIERELREALSETDGSPDVTIETETNWTPEERERRELRGKARLGDLRERGQSRGSGVGRSRSRVRGGDGLPPGSVPLTMFEARPRRSVSARRGR